MLVADERAFEWLWPPDLDRSLLSTIACKKIDIFMIRLRLSTRPSSGPSANGDSFDTPIERLAKVTVADGCVKAYDGAHRRICRLVVGLP